MSRSRFPPNSSAICREARTIAALNHTIIYHLDDVGPNYPVLEYVEGQDLRGPVDFGDVLPITLSFSARFPQP
jgi:hypothetical protein